MINIKKLANRVKKKNYSVTIHPYFFDISLEIYKQF